MSDKLLVTQWLTVRTRELVDHVCAALVLACPDRDHAASRYGQMLRMLAKKLEQMDASVSAALRSRTPGSHVADALGRPISLRFS